MTKNMGTADRVIRIGLAIAVAVLYLSGRVRGVLGIILLIVAAVFVITSLSGRCPGYVPLGVSTRRRPGGSTP